MKWKRKIGILCLGVFLVWYLLFNHTGQISIKCPIYEIFHLYCPGCGVTRMIQSFAKGNFYQAFRYNPLLFLLFPFFLLYFLYSYFCKRCNKKNIIEKWEPKVWYILIGIFLVYGILRNISYFDFLKPTTL